MILAIDIGGTKVRAGLVEVAGKSLKIRHQARFKTHEWQAFMPLVRHFLESVGSPPSITAAAIGIAGPATEERVTLTNLSWVVDAVELRELLGCDTVMFVNDLAAHCHGIPFLTDHDVVTLHQGKPRRGTMAMIAAGTGLGECLVAVDGERVLPLSSEGGHCDFSPRDETELDLLRFLMGRHPDHVSWERVVSGKYGFRNIHDFLLETKRFSAYAPFEEALEGDTEIGPLISAAAEADIPIAVATMELFMDLYGSEAGNLALKGLAVGGLYIAGGIARRNLSFLMDGTFHRSFVRKGRFESLLSDIPVHVVTNTELPILGLAAHAARCGGVEI